MRCFTIPTLDYILMNGQVNSDSLERTDQKIRSVLNRHCGGVHLPVHLFYTDWKDGGLGLQSLQERQHVLKLALLATVQCSPDADTVGWSSTALDEYAKKKNYQTNKGPQEFLNWHVDKNTQYRPAGHDSLAAQSHIAATKLRVGINLGSSGNTLTIRDLVENHCEEIAPKQVSSRITRMLQKRHLSELCKLESRGHAFHCLKNSPISNFFLGNHTAPTSDALVRFAIKGRTDNLPTAKNLKLAGIRPSDKCTSCGQIETLNHRLNGCQAKKAAFTPRHNAVVEIIAALVEKHTHGKVIMNRSRTVKLDDISLPERSKNLKPDLWYVKPDGELVLIEVTIPYAQQTSKRGQCETTLECRRAEKRAKYTDLVADCRATYKTATNLYVFVISSLGAIPKETLDETTRLTGGNEKMAALWVKRMAIACIRESLILFYGLKGDRPASATALRYRGPRKTIDEI